MRRKPSDLIANGASDLTLDGPTVEKGHVLRPRQARHDAQAATSRFVQQGVRRRGVGADCVRSKVADGVKIASDPIGIGNERTGGARGESTVADALDEKASAADLEKLSANRWMRHFQCAGLRPAEVKDPKTKNYALSD